MKINKNMFLYINAALIGLCFIFNQLSLFLFIGFIIYFLNINEMSYKKHFIFFFIIFLFINSFLFEMYPLSFLDITKPIALLIIIIGYLLLSSLMALLYELPLFLYKYNQKHNLLIVVLALVFNEIILEIVHYPLFKIALPLAYYPSLIQSASYYGIYGMGLVIYSINALISYFIKSKKKEYFISLLLIILSVSILSIPPHIEKLDYFKVGLVQANIDITAKWDNDKEKLNYDTYLALSNPYINEVDMMIWPETATLFDYEGINNKAIYKDKLIYGTFNYHNGLYNSIYDIKNDLFYNKQYLVPFGEYVPLLFQLFIDNSLFQLGGNIDKGNEMILFPYDNYHIGNLICFESMISPLSIKNVRKGANILLLVSNDGWYGNIEKQLHYNHAIYRAIETRKMIMRASNDGISAIIDEKGIELASLGNNESGIIVNEVSFNNYFSFFAKYYYLELIALLLIFMLNYRFDKELFIQNLYLLNIKKHSK